MRIEDDEGIWMDPTKSVNFRHFQCAIYRTLILCALTIGSKLARTKRMMKDDIATVTILTMVAGLLLVVIWGLFI